MTREEYGKHFSRQVKDDVIQDGDSVCSARDEPCTCNRTLLTYSDIGRVVKTCIVQRLVACACNDNRLD